MISFTPLRDLFPEPLVAELVQAPAEAVTYCVYALADDSEQQFLFFIKANYAAVQPVVDAGGVPVEFTLRAEEDGLQLTAEFSANKANPPYSCTLRCTFPWADEKALAAFKVLLEQEVWPYFFIDEACEYALTSRVYANPVNDENRALCLKMIADQGLPEQPD